VDEQAFNPLVNMKKLRRPRWKCRCVVSNYLVSNCLVSNYLVSNYLVSNYLVSNWLNFLLSLIVAPLLTL